MKYREQVNFLIKRIADRDSCWVCPCCGNCENYGGYTIKNPNSGITAEQFCFAKIKGYLEEKFPN